LSLVPLPWARGARHTAAAALRYRSAARESPPES
jgi:hypothetical protein